jgi:predicted site-specific integrase-resolvase
MADVEFLTEQHVAERLNVKAATIREWRRLGLIPAVKVSHKVVRYVWADIVESIACRQNESGVAHVG